MKNRELVKSFALSVSFGTIIVGVSKLLNFFLKILVSQLGVVNFGDYYLATSTFTSLTTVTALGIPMSTTRFVSYFRAQHQPKAVQNIIASAVTLIALSAVLVGALFYGYAGSLARMLGTPSAAIYFRVLSFGLIGATLSLLARAVFLGFIRIQLAYTTETIEVALKFIFTVFGMLLLRWGVLGALIGYAVGTLSASLVNIYVLAKISQMKRFAPQFSPKFLRYTWPVSASEIITAATNVLLLYIVQIRGGAQGIGLYAAAVSVASLVHIIPQMILSIFLPMASRYFAQRKSITPIYKTLFLWLGIVVLPPTIGLSLLSAHITTLVFGASYAHAATILSMLAVAYGLYALLVWPNRQLLDMAGFTKENLALTLLRAAISISTLLYVVPEFTGVGLARSVLMGWIGEAVGCLVLVKLKRLI